MDTVPLSELERELLELASMAPMSGETTATLDEEMLESSPGRDVLQTTLRGLVERGLMTTSQGRFVGEMRPRDGVHPRSEAGKRQVVHRDYIDDWWVVSEAGRVAIGKPPRPRPRWMNPSSGPWRVSPLIAPWCAFRVRRGKQPPPAWYGRVIRRRGNGR